MSILFIGENGQPVLDYANSESEVAFAKYGFNVAASDKISLDRSIPDTRHAECKYWHYPENLPRTSVVIVFHNEAWSPLLRTVHSVVNRTPSKLLLEVVMVDDFSDKEHLKNKLDNYVKQKFGSTVRIIRNRQREGLIRTRNIGAENARGQVVVFLDAHCEVNTFPRWLQQYSRRTVTVPVIDSIDMNNWEYAQQRGYGSKPLYRGIFEWGLLYKEAEIPKQEEVLREHQSEPFRTPTHAGGLFAINRDWFEKLGYYDPGLRIWGGENYDLSFKVWQCGGSVLNVPCSRVGHVYRRAVPYSFGNVSGPVVSINYKRVAEVWMDEYKEYYYIREPFIRKRDAGDLTQQRELRLKNRCKSFDWYMKNVAYDMPVLYPKLPQNLVWGEVVNPSSYLCIDTMGKRNFETIGVSPCHHSGGNQLLRLNVKGQFASGEWCISASHGQLNAGRCVPMTVDGPWRYDKTSQQISNAPLNKCVALKRQTSQLVLAECNANDEMQRWVFNEIYL
ncbi:unnamed protein product [Soboliphyme baturini]|uniref:Polypeptide N-acetylgalactosaminyltransferase n=1 Tax=Soboliphyme baturini TaxID=241478 RepID=A0A183IHU7_9BILA|nr:unnamed protein product [Soboliphyme baturini]